MGASILRSLCHWWNQWSRTLSLDDEGGRGGGSRSERDQADGVGEGAATRFPTQPASLQRRHPSPGSVGYADVSRWSMCDPGLSSWTLPESLRRKVVRIEGWLPNIPSPSVHGMGKVADSGRTDGAQTR